MKFPGQFNTNLLLLSSVLLIALLLWAIDRNTWISVFVLGTCLGLYVFENMELNEELQDMEMKILELNAQIEAQSLQNIELKKND